MIELNWENLRALLLALGEMNSENPPFMIDYGSSIAFDGNVNREQVELFLARAAHQSDGPTLPSIKPVNIHWETSDEEPPR